MAGNYIGNLVYRITGDTSGIDKSLQSTKSKTEGFGSFMGGWAVKVAGLFAAAFTVDKLVEFDKKLLAVASHSNEVSSRFNNTFPSAIGKANAAVAELTEQYGYSSTAAKEAMSASGGLLETLGAGDDVAADMSATVAKLGADLASYVDYAGGAKGASDALTKALLGETDSAKGLSLSLGDDALKRYADTLGVNVDQMNSAEKAQLRLNLALSQATQMGAVGDMIRTAQGYANTLRSVESKMEDAEARAGQRLIPVVTDLATEMGKACEPGGVFAGALDTIAEAGAGAASVLTGLLRVLNSVAGTQGKDRIKMNEQNISSYEYQQRTILTLYKGQEAELNRLAKAGDRGAISDKARYDALKAKIKETREENEKLNQSIKDDKKAAALKRYNELIEEDQKTVSGTLSILGRYNKSYIGQSLEEAANNKSNLTAQNAAIDALEQHKKLQAEILQLEKEYNLTAKDIITDIPVTPRNKGKGNGNGGGSGNGSGGGSPAKDIKKEFEQINFEPIKINWDYILSTGKANTTIDELHANLNAALASGNEDAINKAQKAVDDYNNSWQALSDQVTAYGDTASSVLSSVSTIVANSYKNQIDALDEKQRAEEEAAGVADESATQKAQKAYDLAVKSGNQELVNEKKKALVKAQIEEKYAKRKSDLQYRQAVAAWEFQVAQAGIQTLQAPLNAYVSTLGAPYPISLTAPVMAALAFTSAMAMDAAVASAKPKRASFATGGVIGGNAYYGDKVPIWVNSKERVLTPDQNKHFEKMVYGSTNSNGIPCNIVVNLDSQPILSAIETATENGTIIIHANAITTR